MSRRRTVFDRITEVVGSRYAALLLVIVVIIGLHPMVGAHPTLAWLLELMWVALIASSLHAISGHTRLYYVILGLGVLAVVVSTLASSFGMDRLYPYGAVIRLSLNFVVVGVIFTDILRRKQVDLDAVFGACCAYLLVGVAYGAVYSVIDWIFPGSFNIPPEPQIVIDQFGPETRESQLTYFSLITMTTIGYGDITPASPPARMLAALEGLLAQLYLAILVARMVGMELVGRRRRES
jgi:hypothetical protein